MDKIKLIEKIKSQLKEIVSTKVELVEYKSGDLMITSPDEELIIGSEVFMVDSDGNNVPLSDGEYVLDNGVTIAVMGGKVEAIVNSEIVPEEVEAKVEEVKTEEVKAETTETEPTNELQILSERISKLEQLLAEMLKSTQKMESQIVTLSDQPVKSGIEVKETEFKSVDVKKDTLKGANINEIREILKRKKINSL